VCDGDRGTHTSVCLPGALDTVLVRYQLHYGQLCDKFENRSGGYYNGPNCILIFQEF